MARPSTPLISREKATAAALRIIDAHGLNGLNIRALGDALGVKGASLYHHFENKEAIEIAVAEYVLDAARLPTGPEDDWRSVLVEGQVASRDALLRHPKALPLLLRLPRKPAARAHRAAVVEGARRDGLPDSALVILIRGLQSHTIGSAVRAQQQWEASEDEPPFWTEIDDEVPDGVDGFITACHAMIDGILAQHGVPTKRARPTSGVRRNRNRKPAPTR